MKSIGAEFLRPDALPGVNHMRGNSAYKINHIYFAMSVNECSFSLLHCELQQFDLKCFIK